jgi:hypothetical protein
MRETHSTSKRLPSSGTTAHLQAWRWQVLLIVRLLPLFRQYHPCYSLEVSASVLIRIRANSETASIVYVTHISPDVNQRDPSHLILVLLHLFQPFGFRDCIKSQATSLQPLQKGTPRRELECSWRSNVEVASVMIRQHGQVNDGVSSYINWQPINVLSSRFR